MRSGIPVGYATGYLFLLLFIAGPLRRFGAYTIPDFAEGRFDSPLFRKIAVTFVLFIGFFYTMPQMKGAGVTMGTDPELALLGGIVVVGTVITFNVALGGMKGITFVQAFQYWAKMFAIAAPVFVLMAVWCEATASSVQRNGADAEGVPQHSRETPRSSSRGAADSARQRRGLPAGRRGRLAFRGRAPCCAKVGPARQAGAADDPMPDSALQYVSPAPGGSAPERIPLRRS